MCGMWLVCPASPLAICVLSFRVWCCAGAPSSKIGEGTATLPQGRSTRQIDLAKPTLAFPTLAKSNFGQTDFGQKNLTDFGQTDFGQFSFLVFYPSGLHPSEGWGPEWVGLERVGPERVGLERVGAPKGGGPKGGGPKGGGPKVSHFFAFSRHNFAVSVSLWGSSRGIRWRAAPWNPCPTGTTRRQRTATGPRVSTCCR